MSKDFETFIALDGFGAKSKFNPLEKTEKGEYLYAHVALAFRAWEHQESKIKKLESELAMMKERSK